MELLFDNIINVLFTAVLTARRCWTNIEVKINNIFKILFWAESVSQNRFPHITKPYLNICCSLSNIFGFDVFSPVIQSELTGISLSFFHSGRCGDQRQVGVCRRVCAVIQTSTWQFGSSRCSANCSAVSGSGLAASCGEMKEKNTKTPTTAGVDVFKGDPSNQHLLCSWCCLCQPCGLGQSSQEKIQQLHSDRKPKFQPHIWPVSVLGLRRPDSH